MRVLGMGLNFQAPKKHSIRICYIVNMYLFKSILNIP